MDRRIALLALLALGACAHGRHARAPSAASAAAPSWRSIASDSDRNRLWGWRPAFVAALASARAEHGAQIAASGALLEPDAALADPAPPAGAYRCRLVRLGAPASGAPSYGVTAWAPCRIEAGADGLSLTTLAGNQRPGGRLYPQDDSRMVLLGAMRLSGEQGAFGYGRDSERDLAGFLERIGQRRWRVILPGPSWEALFRVIEIVPAA